MKTKWVSDKKEIKIRETSKKSKDVSLGSSFFQVVSPSFQPHPRFHSQSTWSTSYVIQASVSNHLLRNPSFSFKPLSNLLVLKSSLSMKWAFLDSFLSNACWISSEIKCLVYVPLLLPCTKSWPTLMVEMLWLTTLRGSLLVVYAYPTTQIDLKINKSG